MTCSEKACPFPPNDGDILCRYHRQSYAFEISMRDEALDLRSLDFGNPKAGTIDGLRIIYRRSSKATAENKLTDICHKLLGSGRTVKRAIAAINTADPKSIRDWCANVFAAQEFFEHARYGGRPVCCICGAQDYWNIFSGFQHFWKCKRCYYFFSVKRQTIMQDSPLGLDKWCSALVAVCKTENRYAVIKNIQQRLGCTYTTAWKLNHKIRIAGLTVGLDLGFRGQVNNRFWKSVAEKSGVRLEVNR